MALDSAYEYIVVETYIPSSTSGRHGKIHVRPVAGGKYPTTLHVECSKRLRRDYPVGTKFRLLAKLTDREGLGQYLYSNFNWDYEVVR
ncbi:hypothetical protein F3J17_24585 [Burkholderia sp. Ax-1719]|nr:hypothetical protein [Burkholderia sp. Ax-1719]